ncbi:hypothetical protein BDV98DRAFT_592743 [Pterulicium gracile]|uniref:Pyridoxal phosphate-dependent transferase n=1 Tax=Pterulicium gracile TaxID=1884261 RepID=A0A5C3QL91_9AGAR|nr:hypothetical protein BDV98DRAFT_592743 [Pterula gracilis]
MASLFSIKALLSFSVNVGFILRRRSSKACSPRTAAPEWFQNGAQAANVIFPISATAPYSSEALAALKTKILVERNAYGFVLYHNGKWTLRCCAQIYNELEDYEKIGKLFLEVCREVEAEFGVKVQDSGFL